MKMVWFLDFSYSDGALV